MLIHEDRYQNEEKGLGLLWQVPLADVGMKQLTGGMASEHLTAS